MGNTYMYILVHNVNTSTWHGYMYNNSNKRECTYVHKTFCVYRYTYNQECMAGSCTPVPVL